MPDLRYRRQMSHAVPVVAALASAGGSVVAAPAVTLGVRGHGEAVMRVRSRTYELTFAGLVGGTRHAACDVGTVSAGPGTATLRAGLPGQAAGRGLAQPIMGRGPDAADSYLITPGSW